MLSLFKSQICTKKSRKANLLYQVLAASDLEKLLDRSDLTWAKDANKAKKGGVSKKQDAIEGVFKVCNLFIRREFV